jgi:spermidine synthase
MKIETSESSALKLTDRTPKKLGMGWLLMLFGLIFGATITANILAAGEWQGLGARGFLGSIAVGAVVGMILLFGLRSLVRMMVANRLGFILDKAEYQRRDTLTYAVFLLSLACGFGIQVSVTSVYLLVIAFVSAQAVYLFSLYRTTLAGATFFSSLGWLTFLFLVSGMAALVYEIVWQRVLFSAYGVNIESITIIVSLFMFGLGIGSLIGGILCNRFPNSLPQLFVLCEAAIGFFGLISLPLIQFVAMHTLEYSLTGITFVIYGLLSIPTMFMGATLPILVTHLHRHYKHIGKSVGRLYFFNTIGSALACLLTVDVLFVFVGKQVAVTVAALLNFSVAVLVLAYVKKISASRSTTEAIERDGAKLLPLQPARLAFWFVLLLSAMAGFLSLSQEILWMRAVSYNAQGAPQVFGHVLGFFLLGIAFGARRAEKFCTQLQKNPLVYVAGLFLFGALFYHFCVPLFANVTVLSKGLGLLLSYFTVSIVAFIFGNVMPILSHYGIPANRPIGQSLSWIYMANIVGSTAGPLLTGFILMDKFTLQANILYLSIASILFAGFVILASSSTVRYKLGFLAASAFSILILFSFHDIAYAHLFEKLRYGPRYSKKPEHNHILQNRNGIIAVEPNEKGDIIFGGGGYDGRFSLDPVLNSNGIRRAFMIGALHPEPSEVLEIGLSSGSWSWVLAAYTKVKHLTIVEINPGYPKVISAYDDRHRSILNNPKITMHFDDGRRWLRRNADRQFDFILMNTTFHWRSNITNLVSQDFLQMAKLHLRPGGVIYYNATHSEDIGFTAAKVFKYVTYYSTFVAASDSPFNLTAEAKQANFAQFLDGGQAIFGPEHAGSEQVREDMVAANILDQAPAILKRPDLRLITDDNMLTEFKKISDTDAIGYLYQWYNPACTWLAGWQKYSASHPTPKA